MSIVCIYFSCAAKTLDRDLRYGMLCELDAQTRFKESCISPIHLMHHDACNPEYFSPLKKNISFLKTCAEKINGKVIFYIDYGWSEDMNLILQHCDTQKIQYEIRKVDFKSIQSTLSNPKIAKQIIDKTYLHWIALV